MKKLIIFIAALLLAVSAFSQVEKIRVINVTHDANGATNYGAEYRVPLPPQLVGIPHSLKILQSYMGVYNVRGLDTVNNTVYMVFEIMAKPLGLFKVVDNETTNDFNMPADFYAPLVEQYNDIEAQLATFTLLPSDGIIGKVLINNVWVNSQ